MAEHIIGKVVRVAGPVVEAERSDHVKMLELVLVGDLHLIGEVVRIQEHTLWIQVYEDTTNLCPGAQVFSHGEPLSVELGPGLIGGIYDGIQRPLEALRMRTGDFVSRGAQLPALDRIRKWAFCPSVQSSCTVTGGTVLGIVKETELIEHKIMVPPGISGSLTEISGEGEYRITDPIAKVRQGDVTHAITMLQTWPVRIPRPYQKRCYHTAPLLTGQRVIDTLFPVAKGGVVMVPGGFGTGKTMVQHAIAKWCDADLVVYIGCGERGNEMTDVLNEFPKLTDPRTGRSLMERTILIANTSNMPVAAREASIYTGITLAEYYRDMGLHVAVMADSTSRWAEALRELSGRMEEMPADEGFPAYLSTRLAEFYERAGSVSTLAGEDASITIIGAVSPPGGDFSEPVTQHTKRFIRAFWGLDKQLANARHYPAIGWLDSYSEYVEDVAGWWDQQTQGAWLQRRAAMIAIMQQEARLQQVVRLVGADVLPDSQRLLLETAGLFKRAFLQQSQYDKIDAYCSAEKQFVMLQIILAFHEAGTELVKRGISLDKIKQAPIMRDIAQMKFEYDNDNVPKLRALLERLTRSLNEYTNTPA